MVLSIAGYDPTGGAGLLADAAALARLGVRTAGAITALTIQSPNKEVRLTQVDPDFFDQTLTEILSNLPILAVKVGMLAKGEIARVVAAHLLRLPPQVPVVIDPVIAAGGGCSLCDEQAFKLLRDELLPRATLIVPNVPEAERLCNLSIKQPFDIERAARQLRDMGAQYVLIKGGHLEGRPVDTLLGPDGVQQWTHRRREGAEIHGTGCTLAAMIAGMLAQAKPMNEAVGTAIGLLQQAIANSWSPADEGWKFLELVG